MEQKKQEMDIEFSLLLPLVNFKADFLKTAKGSFMEI